MAKKKSGGNNRVGSGNIPVVSNGGNCAHCGEHTTAHADGVWLHEECVAPYLNSRR
ncbi:hypothetical protein ThrDRAFT_01537 [Frankia casuarinae]|jgi:hypothetical protein|uniref:hypothetical protein n=1 Tax=Frankia casuarinae (strain DSM 45818 / CECT 9043 / HFP020203 / CcI3) TaxID=106370 RepID=UPI000315EFE4|nr:hypothetical protein [Frankia casuarinae]EYT92762.1 hypothetical protein ThrDRAFT_01537 [Frankia casuarinae]